MTHVPASIPSPNRADTGRRALALVFLLMACASARTRCHPDEPPATTGNPSTTSNPSTTTGAAGEIDDSEVVAVDRALQALLKEIYRDARRTTWKREDGPGSRVFTLEYSLAQAHTQPAAVVLQGEMLARGFEVDRVLDDERVTTVFAAHAGFPVIVTVDVGAKLLVATVERAGP
jgi:hypothetical protein